MGQLQQVKHHNTLRLTATVRNRVYSPWPRPTHSNSLKRRTTSSCRKTRFIRKSTICSLCWSRARMRHKSRCSTGRTSSFNKKRCRSWGKIFAPWTTSHPWSSCRIGSGSAPCRARSVSFRRRASSSARLTTHSSIVGSNRWPAVAVALNRRIRILCHPLWARGMGRRRPPTWTIKIWLLGTIRLPKRVSTAACCTRGVVYPLAATKRSMLGVSSRHPARWASTRATKSMTMWTSMRPSKVC